MSKRTKKILVFGGAGYIGSHMVKILGREGFSVTTVDNLVHGYREAVTCGEFIRGDLADRDFLARLFNEHRFDCVIHFASFIQVGESMVDPALYYRSNLINTQNLLEAMVESDHLNLIFSSSAAIYGEPKELPITEEILADFDRAYGMKSACLRYFNAAGADPEGELGERHQPESHLIPLVLRAASGRMEEIIVNGRNHETPDGTCLRDYIHVNDLCRAHILAMEKVTGKNYGSTKARADKGTAQYWWPTRPWPKGSLVGALNSAILPRSSSTPGNLEKGDRNMKPSNYVIHVKKGYEDREESIKSQFAALNLDFEWVLDFDIPELTPDKLSRYRYYGSKLNQAEISCSMKHIQAWEKIAAQKTPGNFVFEDDFLIGQNFSAMAAAAVTELEERYQGRGYLSLGDGCAMFVPWTRIEKSRLLYPAKQVRATDSYYLSRDTARAMSLARDLQINPKVDLK